MDRIEKTALGHFKYLPEKLGFPVKSWQGLTIINCGLGSSMFNIVFGGLRSDSANLSSLISEIIEQFKGEPFAWWIPQSEKSQELRKALLDSGFHIEAAEQAMICDLNFFSDSRLKTDIVIRQAATDAEIQDFIQIIEPYDASASRFYQKLPLSEIQLKEKLFIGYFDGKPATAGILFEGEGACGIFSILTKQEMRGKGFGTDMMRFLLDFAKAKGHHYATLSASSDSGFRIYERLGFKQVGAYECFEYR